MSRSYRVLLRPAAVRDLDRLSGPLFDQVTAALRRLQSNPLHKGAKKLSQRRNQWRLRVRDHRVLYEVNDGAQTVLVFRVRHRSQAYR
mgnify:CR=1 FL=1